MPKVQRSPPSTPVLIDDMAENQFVKNNPRTRQAGSSSKGTEPEFSSVLAAIEMLRKDMNNRFYAQQSNFDDFKSTLSQLCTEVTDLSSKVAIIKKDFDEKSNAIDFLSSCQDEQTKITTNLLGKIKILERDNASLSSTVSGLFARVTEMEQQSRTCNIELQCVPEARSENLLTIVDQLLRVVSSEVPESSVISVHRVAKQRADSDRPRSIIVKLATPKLRDTVLAAAIKFNKSKKNRNDKLNAQHLGFANSNHPIFVSEHLTPANKRLHAATRLVAREKGYEFVWIRNGRIFIRKNAEAAALIVRNEDFLRTLI